MPDHAEIPIASAPSRAPTPAKEDSDDEFGQAAGVTDGVDTTEATDTAQDIDAVRSRRHRRISRVRVFSFAVLPGLALILALGAGYLKWQDNSARHAQDAAVQSVQAATVSTVALLSYRSDTAEKDLMAARDRLTGAFRDSYTSLTNDVVIPGAKQKQISATATVPAAASISAGETHAEVLVFVDQTTTIGNDAPTTTTSSVRVTLDKVHDRWLISQFDPV